MTDALSTLSPRDGHKPLVNGHHPICPEQRNKDRNPLRHVKPLPLRVRQNSLQNSSSTPPTRMSHPIQPLAMCHSYFRFQDPLSTRCIPCKGFSVKMTQVIPTPAGTPPVLYFTLRELDRGPNKTNVSFALTFPSPHFTKADVTVNVMVYLCEVIDLRSE